jgi:hypothetical protein
MSVTGGTMYLYGGDYYNDDFSGPNLDGGLWTFDLASETLAGPLLTEEELGANIGNLAIAPGGKGILTTDDGYTWDVWCIDLADESVTLISQPGAFIGGASLARDGRVWLAQRPDYLGSTDPQTGVVVYDPATCLVETTHRFGFDPYSMAFSE